MLNRRVVVASVVAAILAGTASAQTFPVTATDLPRMKLNHYFTPDKKSHDPEFVWTFTETGFTVKKGTGPIPNHLIEELLPDGVMGDEITGKWALKDGKLELTDIKAGKQDGKKDVRLPIFKTAPTVVRICDPNQFAFGIHR